MKRRVLIALVVAAVAAAATWFYGVRVPDSLNGGLILYGNVDIRQVDLGFRAGGRIATMNLEEGDPVIAGAVMALLDKQPFEDDVRLAEAEVASRRATLTKFEAGSRPAEIAQAQALVAERQAGLNNAALVLQRQQSLIEKGHVSRQAYDDALAQKTEAQARLNSAHESLDLVLEGFREEDIAVARANMQMAEARLARAQTNLADTEIVSPSDGILLSRIHEPGAIVATGAPVYTLSLTRSVWVRTYIAEPDLGRIHPGMKAMVATDSAPNRAYQGHIGFISPVAEFTPKNVETADLRTDLVYRLRIIIEDTDQGLRQGMPVTVTVQLDPQEE